MIKECTLNDVAALQHIATKTFCDTFAAYNTAEDMEKYIQQAYAIEKLRDEINVLESCYYFLEIDNQVAGYLKLNWDSAQSEPMGEKTLEIQCLYVDSAYKRQGFGKSMINFAIEKARLLNKNKIWLGVWENNHKAIAFYQSLGFKRTGEHTFLVGDDEQLDYIMTLDI